MHTRIHTIHVHKLTSLYVSARMCVGRVCACAWNKHICVNMCACFLSMRVYVCVYVYMCVRARVCVHHNVRVVYMYVCELAYVYVRLCVYA